MTEQQTRERLRTVVKRRELRQDIRDDVYKEIRRREWVKVFRAANIRSKKRRKDAESRERGIREKKVRQWLAIDKPDFTEADVHDELVRAHLMKRQEADSRRDSQVEYERVRRTKFYRKVVIKTRVVRHADGTSHEEQYTKKIGPRILEGNVHRSISMKAYWSKIRLLRDEIFGGRISTAEARQGITAYEEMTDKERTELYEKILKKYGFRL
jgi:hypothetical protein